MILGQHPLNVIGIITGTSIFFVLNQLYVEKNLFRKTALIFCLFPLGCLIISGQLRSTFLGLLLAGFFFFGHSKKKMFVFLGLILAVLAVTPVKNRLDLNSIMNNERLNIYSITFEIIKKHRKGQ